MDPFSTRASSAKPPKAPNTIGFRAAEPEAAGDRQRHLVAAVRGQPWRASIASVREILHDTVGLRQIDLDHVPADDRKLLFMRRFGTQMNYPATSDLAQLRNLSSYWKERTSRPMAVFTSDILNHSRALKTALRDPSISSSRETP